MDTAPDRGHNDGRWPRVPSCPNDIAMPSAHFLIKRDKAGEHRFDLVAPNGQVILSSEGYSRKANCLKGIESVRRHSAEDVHFERVIGAKGQYHFNLKASNSQVIGTSERYNTPQSMENGIRSVRLHATEAGVVESH